MKFLIIFFSIFVINYSCFSKNIFETSFYNVNENTNNASETKFKQIEYIKKKSFINIIDRIILPEDKKVFLKNYNYSQDLDQIVLNIIIENELITSDKYIADIKVNFDKRELIQILRNKKVNYSDIFSNDMLIISTYSEDFLNLGLTNENILYNYEIDENKNNLFNYFFPKLNPNDRFIIPYKKIINQNKISLRKIADKYNVKEIILINLINNNNDNIDTEFYYYNSSSNKISFINKNNFKYNENFHREIFIYLNNWWKKKNIINNNIINKIECYIKSLNYDDLMYIKSQVINLSQTQNIDFLTISFNNNLEEIKYYGDFSILKKNLSFLNISININNKNECIISSVK